MGVASPTSEPARGELVAPGSGNGIGWPRGHAQHLQLALEAAQLGTWQLDPHSGRMLACGRTRQLLGLDADVPLGMSQFVGALHPPDRARVQEALLGASADAEEKLREAEFRVVRGGEERHLALRGRVTLDDATQSRRVTGIVVDITPQKRAEAAMRRSEELRADLFALAPDCLWAVDAGGTVRDLNPHGQQVFGLAEAAQVVGKTWLDLWHGEHRERAAEAMRRAARDEVARFDGMCETRPGRAKWWSVAVSPVLDREGRVDQFFIPMRDITEMKRIEAESRRQAVFAQRLLGIVSHDLRNPVAAVIMSGEALLHRRLASTQREKLATRIVSAAERAERLIRDLLDFTQASIAGGIPLQRQVASVPELLRQVIDEVGAAQPQRHIDLHVSGEGAASFDADRLAQVFTNLLRNALQYSPQNAVVEVTCRDEPLHVVMTCTNPGEPVRADLLPRLFEPLERGSQRDPTHGRSIGLGLYIVKKIVDGHGGDVAMTSSLAAGTSVTVRLPRCAQRPIAGPM